MATTVGFLPGAKKKLSTEEWAVGGRSFGRMLSWFILAGEIYTAFAFLGGSAQEPDDKAGVSELLSALLTEGAGDLDGVAFKNKLVDQSTRLSFIASRDAFFGSLDLLARRAGRRPY